MTAILGIDSLLVSSPAALANASSASYLGQAPAFWGDISMRPGKSIPKVTGTRTSLPPRMDSFAARAFGFCLLHGRPVTSAPIPPPVASMPGITSMRSLRPSLRRISRDLTPMFLSSWMWSLKSRLIRTIMLDGLRRSVAIRARFQGAA